MHFSTITSTTLLLLLQPLLGAAVNHNMNDRGALTNRDHQQQQQTHVIRDDGDNDGEHDSDDDGPVDITLWESKDDDDADPNLKCDDSDDDLGTTCDDIPFGDCCHGEDDDDLFDSAETNHPDGFTSFGIYSGSGDDPCSQVITSSKDKGESCLAGGESGSSITGASTEGENSKRRRRGEDKQQQKRAPRAVKVSQYTYRNAKRGTIHHLPIRSPLGEEYRKLQTRKERRDFLAEHGVEQPYAAKERRRAAE